MPLRSIPIPLSVRFGFVAAFIILGVWAHRTLGGYIPRVFSSPLGATETVLSMILGEPSAGPALVRLVEAAPLERPVVLFVPDTDPNSAMFIQNLACLAWPRRFVSAVLTGPDGDQRYSDAVASNPGLILFYRLTVPMKKGQSLGSKLIYFRMP